MEDEAFTDIRGKPLSLACQSHSGFCREFTVSSAKMSIGKVLAYTCCVWLLAYAVFWVTEVSQIPLNINICTNLRWIYSSPSDLMFVVNLVS